MSDEDRKTAIDMYNELFDEAYNESALIQYLISPTKQAVLVARAYNLVGASPEKVLAEGEDPEFVKLIVATGNEYLNNVEVVPPQEDIFDDNQMSLFDNGAKDEAPVVTEEEPTVAEVPEEVVPEEDTPADEVIPEEEVSEEPAAEEPETPAEEIPAETAEKPAPEEEPEKPSEEAEVTAFLEEYRSPVEEEPAAEESPAAEEEKPAEEVNEKAAPAEPEVFRTEKKLNVFLLLLYLIPAIPLGIAGVALMIIPTVAFLALAGISVVSGVYVVSTAIAGFAVLADLFVVTGLAIVLLSLGLLFLWLFIWCIGGAMAGIVKGLTALGKKICIREVRVNG